MTRAAAWVAGLLMGALLSACAPEPPSGPGQESPSSGYAVDPVAAIVTSVPPEPLLLDRPAPPPPTSLAITPEDVGSAAASAEVDADGVISLSTGLEDDPAAPGSPVRVTVPRLAITSTLDTLGLRPDGILQAPPRWERAGWFGGGPRPGEQGPAVIAGHLDSPTGAAVFAALPQMRRGDRVIVTDDAGVDRTFEVTFVTRTPKRGFPTRQVYGAVPGPELRLITCTGEYRAEAGGYQDNLLVFARLVR